MATQATAQVLAKGPLSSALGQWVFLGFGTFVIFTGDNGISRAAQEFVSVAFRLATGWDGPALMREAALAKQAAAASLQAHPQQPIIIHSAASDSAKSGGWTGTMIQLGLGAGACWTAYLLFANFLPDQVKEMLPVTRKFFESAVSSLGQGIIRVRDLLSEQISALGTKQDELSRKQDETHDSVLGLKDDIGHVRLDIDDVAAAISRCEDSLSDAAGRQTYMSRGVRLLVQCVGDLLRPSNPSVAEELDQFSRLSAELMDDRRDFGSPGRGGDASIAMTRSKSFDCPSSPNLSEIGSAASTARRDDHHHPGLQSLSLPRAHPGKKVVTPTPNPPPGLMGMPTPRLRLMSSFADRTVSGSSGGTAATAASSSAASLSPPVLDSSPENEVPRNNSFSAHPPVKLEDMDVDDVLRFVRSGGDRNSIIRV